jgi:PIN domain nuclease of toxin-antitoxin system
MAGKYVIDTHALVWFLEDNPKLAPAAKAVLSDPLSQLIVPAIVLAEACWMANNRRTNLLSAAQVLDAVLRDPRVVVDPLDVQSVRVIASITTLRDIHDFLVVAPALRRIGAGESVALVTADAAIHAAAVVPVLW